MLTRYCTNFESAESVFKCISDFNIFPKFREANNLLTTGLYDRLRIKPHP